MNQVKQLKTRYSRSTILLLATPLAFEHKTWYKSTDRGKTWQALYDQKANIDVTTDKAGITYYQERVFWTLRPFAKDPIFTDTTIYSRLAKVTTFDTPLNATSVSVSTDKDYLYNIPSLTDVGLAKHHPVPEEATGLATWSTSNSDLATIDIDMGLITANDQRKSGKVDIIVNLFNSDTTTVIGKKTITVGGGDHKSFTTNTATLTVDKKVAVDLNAKNQTYQDSRDKPLELNSVDKDDQIKLTGQIDDSNVSSKVANGKFSVKIPEQTDIQRVMFNGNLSSNFTVNDLPDEKAKQIVFNDFSMTDEKKHSFEIDFSMLEKPTEDFVGRAEFLAYDQAGKELSEQGWQDDLKINFFDDFLVPIGQKIDFGSINHFGTDNEITGKIDNNNSEILQIDDKRRDKKAQKVFVNVEQPLLDNGEMQTEFRLYDDSGSFKKIGPEDVLIQQSEDGEPLQSVIWQQKLKLFVPKGEYSTGKYQTTLNWEIRDSI